MNSYLQVWKFAVCVCVCVVYYTALLTVIGCFYSVLWWPSCDQQSDVWWGSRGICSLSDWTWICTWGMLTFDICHGFVLHSEV